MKECYFYLDSTPTHSYVKALYKYPQAAFPYDRLVEENRRRSRPSRSSSWPTPAFSTSNRYFDVFAEYAKASPNDMLIRITVANRGPEPRHAPSAAHALVPQHLDLGLQARRLLGKPRLRQDGAAASSARARDAGAIPLLAEPDSDARGPLLFTENETNVERLFGAANAAPFVKDAFHEYVVHGRTEAVNPSGVGTKAAAHYRLDLAAGGESH